MRPLNIQGCLECPTNLVTIGWVEGNSAKRRQHCNRGWIRQAIACIESLQILLDGGATKRIDDDDCLAGPRVASVQDGRQAVCISNLLRAIAGNANRTAAQRVGGNL